MDPLAILRSGFLGNRSGDYICAGVSAAVEIDAAEAHTCRAHYVDDHPVDGDSAVNAGRRVVAAGRDQRLREDPVGRAEYKRVFSAALWRSTGMIIFSIKSFLPPTSARLDTLHHFRKPPTGRKLPTGSPILCAEPQHVMASSLLSRISMCGNATMLFHQRDVH